MVVLTFMCWKGELRLVKTVWGSEHIIQLEDVNLRAKRAFVILSPNKWKINIVKTFLPPKHKTHTLSLVYFQYVQLVWATWQYSLCLVYINDIVAPGTSIVEKEKTFHSFQKKLILATTKYFTPKYIFLKSKMFLNATLFEIWLQTFVQREIKIFLCLWNMLCGLFEPNRQFAPLYGASDTCALAQAIETIGTVPYLNVETCGVYKGCTKINTHHNSILVDNFFSICQFVSYFFLWKIYFTSAEIHTQFVECTLYKWWQQITNQFGWTVLSYLNLLNSH